MYVCASFMEGNPLTANPYVDCQKKKEKEKLSFRKVNK